MTLKELGIAREKVVAQMKDLGERLKRNETEYEPDVEKQFDKWDEELNSIDKKMGLIKRAEDLETVKTESIEKKKEEKSEGPNYSETFYKYLTRGLGELDKNEKQLLKANFDRGESRAQGTATGSGGYTIPEDFAKTIEVYMAYYGPFAGKQACTVWNSETGATMPYPVIDDTANTGALLAEAGDAAASVTDVTDAEVSFGAYKYTSKMIKINQEIIEDSYFNFVEVIADRLAERLGRIINTTLTTGDGSSKPSGIITGATQGKLSAAVDSFTQDELIDLQFSLNWAYQNRPLTGWMMHQNSLAMIRKLDASTSNYTQAVWQPRFGDNIPETILGKPYFVNNDLDASLATGDKGILYGDFSKFVARWVGPMRLRRVDELYAANDQVGVVAFQRIDSNVINTGAIKYLEMT